jgi:hypothetical protein
MRRFSFGRVRWLLGGAVAGAIVAGGAAFAAIPDSSGVIKRLLPEERRQPACD